MAAAITERLRPSGRGGSFAGNLLRATLPDRPARLPPIVFEHRGEHRHRRTVDHRGESEKPSTGIAWPACTPENLGDVGHADGLALRTLGGVLAITGGLLLAVSAFRPWIRSTPGLVADPTSFRADTVSGMDGGDGIFFLVGGVLIAALGLWTTLSRPKAAPILFILSGLAFGLLGLFEYNSIGDNIRGYNLNHCCDMGGFALGEGIWWIYAWAAATFLAGLVLDGQMRVQHPSLSTSQ